MTATSSAPHSALNSSFDQLLHIIDPVVASILDKALDGKEITAEEAFELFKTKGTELNALILVANELRRSTVGDTVTFVINRNINFTNICVKRCGFCAFSKRLNEPGAYLLSVPKIVEMAKEATLMGATEVCILLKTPPGMKFYRFVPFLQAVIRQFHELLDGIQSHSTCISWNAVSHAAKQLVHRHIASFPKQVPQSAIDGSNGKAQVGTP